MATVLIFGVSGQDGYYLTELLERLGHKVVGVSRSSGSHPGSVGNSEFVKRLVADYCPEYVFHLAATSSVRHDACFANQEAISAGTLNVLEAVRVHNPSARVFLSGSGLQFVNNGSPISEQCEFEARSPYSAARIHSTYLGRYYRFAFGLKVYCGFLFNHDSPRREANHISRSIVDTVGRIAAGSGEVLRIGNPDVRKEYCFAGDTVEAIWQLVNQERVYEAVIGSGEAHTIWEWADYCFRRIGRRAEDHVVLDAGFKADYKTLVSDPTLIRSLGWSPVVGFEALADMMLGRT